MSGNFCILDTEIIVPTGVNKELAIAVAQADIDRFSTHTIDNNKYTVAELEFISKVDLFTKTTEVLNYLLKSLLIKLPESLKPISLMLSIPDGVSTILLKEWIKKSNYETSLSNVIITTDDGNDFIKNSFDILKNNDALLSIAIDSLFELLPDLIKNNEVLCGENPWGLLPSEGGGGVIFVNKIVLDKLNIIPQSEIIFYDFDWNSNDRRGCSRLIRRASKTVNDLSNIYSDMTNQREHLEDYGFAIGARSKLLINGPQAILTNEYWGSTGGSSGIITLSTMSYMSNAGDTSASFLFDRKSTRSLIILNKN